MPQIAQKSEICSNHQQSSMRTMQLSGRSKQVNFDGIGSVKTTYYRISENLPNGIFEELKSVVISLMKEKGIELPKMDNATNEIFSCIKLYASELGLVGKKGELHGLLPKRVVISHGTGNIPDNFVASEIEQVGGEIEGVLNADNVVVSGGKNHGVKAKDRFVQSGPKTVIDGNVYTDLLIADNTTLSHIVNARTADFKNTSIDGTLCVDEDVVTHGCTKFLPDSVSIVDGKVNFNDEVTVGGRLRFGELETVGHTELLQGSRTTANVVNLKGKTDVNGKLNSVELNASESTSFFPGSETVVKNAVLGENTVIDGKMEVKGLLTANDKSQFQTNSKTMANDAVLSGNANVSGNLTVNNELRTSGDVTLLPGSEITSKRAELSGTSVEGKLNVDELDAKNGVQFLLGSVTNVKGKATLREHIQLAGDMNVGELETKGCYKSPVLFFPSSVTNVIKNASFLRNDYDAKGRTIVNGFMEVGGSLYASGETVFRRCSDVIAGKIFLRQLDSRGHKTSVFGNIQANKIILLGPNGEQIRLIPGK